ncbi:hypothetical protein [Photobacterium sanguinicancri]|uniref:hypothetical protein n=1 Tax=Photobacterium sanguinicancri TaxID=875932 RepID=UPI0021C2F79D|nr:hypothetical protein [Photobacterium sanguinicancri]
MCLLLCLTSFTVSSNVVVVNQGLLKKTFNCNDKNKSVCFIGAELYSEYDIYIFNFSMKVKVKGSDVINMNIEEHIRKTLEPMLGILNVNAAIFYNIEPIMKDLVYDSNVQKLIL